MFKTKDFSENGMTLISRAYELAFKHPDAEKRKASLSALKKQLEAALGLDDLSQAKKLQIFEIRTRLKAHLHKQECSPPYIRNQNSTLNFVLRCDVILDGNRDFDEWGALLDGAIAGLSTQESLGKLQSYLVPARQYWVHFFEQNQVTRKDFKPDVHFKSYRKFLTDDCGLNPEGKGRLIVKASKLLLSEMGYTLKTQSIPVPLPERFQKMLDVMGEFAMNSQQEAPLPTHLDDPFADIPGAENGKIRLITWEVRRKDLERYLRHWRTEYPEIFETSELKDWLNQEKIKTYLTQAYREGRFSAYTAETVVNRLAQFMKYANATQIGGFAWSDEELAENTKNLWSLVGNIRKKFRKSTVNERLAKKGGVPPWEGLHQSFEEACIREGIAIRSLQKQAEKLRKEFLAEARNLDLRIAIKLRDLIQASFHLYSASRPRDPRQNIRTHFLARISPEFFSLNYLPSKTSGQKKPATVDLCLPPWLTPAIEVYLDRYQPLIFEGTDLLFPADKRRKNANSSVAHPGPARKGNQYSAMARLTKKFFGSPICANNLRYSLTGFFDNSEMGGLYRSLGHRPDRSMNKLTSIEHEHYLRKDDHQRLRIAKRQYGFIAELLKEPEKLAAVLKSLKE